MSNTIIKLENVTKTFQIDSQKVDALNGIDLEVAQGQQIAVVGRSGSGKSTLLHLIGTLDSASSGKVYLGGVDTSSLKDSALSQLRNRTVGFVFQTNNLMPEFSAIENVMMPGFVAGYKRKDLEATAKSLLCSVGLEHRMNHRPSELSGGEQQRVTIARALLMKPSIILADEPTGSLDKHSSEKVEDLLYGLCKEHNITMMLVTHNPAIADRLPSKVIMEDGLIIEKQGVW